MQHDHNGIYTEWRLSLAGEELLVSNIHIIDLAFKYGYETHLLKRLHDSMDFRQVWLEGYIPK